MMFGYHDLGGIGVLGLIWLALSVASAVAVIALIVLGIRWLIRNTDNRPGSEVSRPGEDSALAVLRERFARGEIDATEYEERKRILGG